MKRTNREKSSIMVWFIFTIIVFLLSALYLLFSLYPSYLGIEQIKLDVIEKQDKINKLSKIGLSYKDFKKLSTSYLNSKNKEITKKEIPEIEYKKKLLLKTDKYFYKKNYLWNTWSTSYSNFLDSTNILLQKELKQNAIWLEKKIVNILPHYSSNYVYSQKESDLTDFKFTNYLENLFEKFNLEYNGSLWINNIESYYKWDWDLDTSIFYVPMSFNLKWRKKDIINFIHYIENVWNLYIKDKTDDVLVLYNDSFITDDFGKKIILEDNVNSDLYNIYNHQLSDISYIKMSNYIDSSYLIRDKKENLWDFIKTDKNQKNEKFSIDIGINFYTVWAKNYEIKNSINAIIKNYNWLLLTISSMLKDSNLVKSKKTRDKIKLKKLKDLFKTLDKDRAKVNWIKKKMTKKSNLRELYKEAIIYDKIIKRSSFVAWEKIYPKK